jgi:hypothetical protein
MLDSSLSASPVCVSVIASSHAIKHLHSHLLDELVSALLRGRYLSCYKHLPAGPNHVEFTTNQEINRADGWKIFKFNTFSHGADWAMTRLAI